MISASLVLTGQTIELVPLEEDHLPPLTEIALSVPSAFKLTSTPVSEEGARQYFARAFQDRDAGRSFPFAIRTRTGGKIIGTTRYKDLNVRASECGIGFTWIAVEYHGTDVNAESKLLLLAHAFGKLGVRRVHLQADERNVQSRRAIERLGATYECTLPAHEVAKDGTLRNTVVYSFLAADWPTVKEKLEERLAMKRAPPFNRPK